MIAEWIAVATGGALGALFRYGAGKALDRLFGTGFPVGTLVINVMGCFLMGLAASPVLFQNLPEAPWNALVIQGGCGALTTFSTFSADSFKLLISGRYASALGNVLLSFVLCLSAVAMGIFLSGAGQV